MKHSTHFYTELKRKGETYSKTFWGPGISERWVKVFSSMFNPQRCCRSVDLIITGEGGGGSGKRGDKVRGGTVLLLRDDGADSLLR